MADERRGRPAFSSKEYTRNSTKESTSDSFQSIRQPYPAGKAIIWIIVYLVGISIVLYPIWIFVSLLVDLLNFLTPPGV